MSATPALEVFDRYVVELEQLAADKRAAGDTAEVIELDIRRTKQARDNVERLIAAAPELLEALQYAREWILEASMRTSIPSGATLERVGAAIAKATGGAA